jgi:hypothetical protein
MLAWNKMLDDTELEGHIDSWIAYEGVLRRDQVSVLPCRIYKAWGKQQTKCGNGVIHAEAITAMAAGIEA